MCEANALYLLGDVVCNSLALRRAIFEFFQNLSLTFTFLNIVDIVRYPFPLHKRKLLKSYDNSNGLFVIRSVETPQKVIIVYVVIVENNVKASTTLVTGNCIPFHT
jgi:hypothetical protein